MEETTCLFLPARPPESHQAHLWPAQLQPGGGEWESHASSRVGLTGRESHCPLPILHKLGGGESGSVGNAGQRGHLTQREIEIEIDR